MSDFMLGIIAGGYLVGAVGVFVLSSFFCVLGGRDGDLWQPFVYALFWPIMWIVSIARLCASILRR